MKIREAYDQAVRRRDYESKVLFQRVNFFLIGTAFLITGFATLVGNADLCELECKKLLLAYTINGAGLYLSILFAYVNYLNANILWQIGKYVEQLEDKLSEKADQDIKVGGLKRIGKMAISVTKIIGHPRKSASSMCSQLKKMSGDFGVDCIAPHTWILPIGFTVFWVVVFFVILPPSKISTSIVFGILGFIPLLVIKSCNSKGNLQTRYARLKNRVSECRRRKSVTIGHLLEKYSRSKRKR